MNKWAPDRTALHKFIRNPYDVKFSVMFSVCRIIYLHRSPRRELNNLSS